MFRAKISPPKKYIFSTDNIRASVTNCMSASPCSSQILQPAGDLVVGLQQHSRAGLGPRLGNFGGFPFLLEGSPICYPHISARCSLYIHSFPLCLSPFILICQINVVILTIYPHLWYHLPAYHHSALFVRSPIFLKSFVLIYPLSNSPATSGLPAADCLGTARKTGSSCRIKYGQQKLNYQTPQKRKTQQIY